MVAQPASLVRTQGQVGRQETTFVEPVARHTHGNQAGRVKTTHVLPTNDGITSIPSQHVMHVALNNGDRKRRGITALGRAKGAYRRMNARKRKVR